MQKPHHKSYYIYFERKTRFKRIQKESNLFSILKSLSKSKINVPSLHYHFEQLKRMIGANLRGTNEDSVHKYEMSLPESGVAAQIKNDNSIVFDDEKMLWNRLFKNPKEK